MNAAYLSQPSRCTRLFSIVSLTLLGVTVTYAQDPELLELETFTTTGSLIPATDTALDAQASPLIRLERADIEKYGYANTSEFLRNLTVNNGGGVPVSNNATGFTPGAASMSLRGLGSDATLVLINGKRVAAYPRGDEGTTAFVDLNSIPLEAIERIEILKDGASSIYGADAIAGVVNITMRSDFEGSEFTVRYGNTFDEDSSEVSASYLVGYGSDRFHITAGAHYYSRNAIFNRDRDYSALPLFVSTNARPVNTEVSYAAIEEAYLNAGLTPPDGLFDPDSGDLFDSFSFVSPTYLNYIDGSFIDGLPLEEVTGTETIDQYLISDLIPDGFELSYFNFNLTSQSFPEQERVGGFATYEYDVIADGSIQLYGDVYYQQTEIINELAPTATGNFSNPTGASIVIPARTAAPIGGRLDGVPVDAFNPWNLFNEDISGFTRMRIWEHGNRVDVDTTDAFLATVGLRVDDMADTSWDLDVSVRYSRIEIETEAERIQISAFNEILNQASPLFQTGGEFEGQAAFNPFNSYLVDIKNNFDLIDYATVNLISERESDLAFAQALLVNPELLELPGGEVGIALGYEHRRESVTERPALLAYTGAVSGESTATITDAARSTQSVFAEMDIPIVSPEQDAPGIHSLDIVLAGRYENFVTQKDSTFVGKGAVRYQPIEDLTLRASWSEGYRQPSLFELFAEGQTATLTGIRDPLTDEEDPEVDATIASSPLLEAEEAVTQTVGFVYSPSQIPGFTVSFDYWDVEREGKVDVNLQDVVNRDASGGTLLPGESVERSDDGRIVLVNGVFRNVGATETDGFDITINYGIATDIGFWEFGASATRTLSYEVQDFEGAPFHDYLGFPTDIVFQNFDEDGNPTPNASPTFDQSRDAYLKWRGAGYVQWNYEGFGVRVNTRYIDGYKDKELDPMTLESTDREVEDRWIFDAQVSYSLMPDSDDWYGAIDVTLGVNNVFDEDPPFVSGDAFNAEGYPSFLYTSENRFWYLSLSKQL